MLDFIQILFFFLQKFDVVFDLTYRLWKATMSVQIYLFILFFIIDANSWGIKTFNSTPILVFASAIRISATPSAILSKIFIANSDGSIPLAVVSSVLLYVVPSAFNAFNDNDVFTYPGDIVVILICFCDNSARKPSKYPWRACLLAAYEVLYGIPIFPWTEETTPIEPPPKGIITSRIDRVSATGPRKLIF